MGRPTLTALFILWLTMPSILIVFEAYTGAATVYAIQMITIYGLVRRIGRRRRKYQAVIDRLDPPRQKANTGCHERTPPTAEARRSND